jgi:hypothetical protein
MTTDQLVEKTESMLPSVMEGLQRTIRRLASSGAIDAKTSTNFVEAKAILCAALRQEVNQWRPLDGESADEKNLMSF